MSLENFMRIMDELNIPLTYLLYESRNKIPIVECIQNVLHGKSEKQQEYLVHMFEEIAIGLDKLL